MVDEGDDVFDDDNDDNLQINRVGLDTFNDLNMIA